MTPATPADVERRDTMSISRISPYATAINFLRARVKSVIVTPATWGVITTRDADRLIARLGLRGA